MTNKDLKNIHFQKLSISNLERERITGHVGKVLWITGLSGSGKSTLANSLEIELNKQNFLSYTLDGDNLRHGLNKDLGFSQKDRTENIRRTAEVAKLMLDCGIVVIIAMISPYIRDREIAKNLIGSNNFVEIFVNTSLEVCELRDPKGLYKKARNGEINNMTGVSSPYEPPTNPDFEVDGSKPYLKILTQICTFIKAVNRGPK